MFWKGMFVGLAITAAPLCLFSRSEHIAAEPLAESDLLALMSDPVDGTPAAGSQDGVARIRAAFRKLDRRLATMTADMEARIARAQERAEAAERRTGELEREVDALWEQRETSRDRDCTPSRARIARWQRLHRRGDEERAGAALDRMVATIGRSDDSLNNFAWELLTDGDYRGRHDALALALAEQLQRRARRLTHYMMDTVALAKFRAGEIESAIRLQREAIRRGGNDRGYRDRLRQYESAAKKGLRRLIAGD